MVTKIPEQHRKVNKLMIPKKNSDSAYPPSIHSGNVLAKIRRHQYNNENISINLRNINKIE